MGSFIGDWLGEGVELRSIFVLQEKSFDAADWGNSKSIWFDEPGVEKYTFLHREHIAARKTMMAAS